MATKSILLALAEPQASVDIAQALGDGWEATSVSTEADAVAQLEQRTFDALLADFNLGSTDASELLNQVFGKRPKMLRFLLAHEADLALVAAKVDGPHEILPKPIMAAAVKKRIESEFSTPSEKPEPGGSEKSAGGTPANAIPAIYAEVLAALESPGASNREVARIIARDEALAAEVTMLAHSAQPGSPRDIDAVDAVELLGLETVKALVMARRFLAEHSHLRPGYMSLDELWQHSTRVARLARDLVLFETNDHVLAAEALVAGLLHDLGKVVLATNFNDWYGRVHSLARKQPVALWDIEKEMFGANHGEIGACLVGMWNMPYSVVEAAASHHEPPLGEHQQLTPLAAVHIADVLENELRPDEEFRVAPVMNTAFLNEIGLLQRLPVWRAAVARRRTANAKARLETAEDNEPKFIPPVPSTPPPPPPPRTANHLPPPAAPTATATAPAPESAGRRLVARIPRSRSVIYAGAAITIALLALWLRISSEQSIRALTYEPRIILGPVAVAPAPVLEPASAASEAALAAAVPDDAPPMEDTPALVADMFLSPGPSLLQPTPGKPVAPATATPGTPSPAAVPPAKARPEFRLNGIIYTVNRPAAIMNGQTVYVGDWVDGATVVGIHRTDVVLRIKGQLKTFTLH